MHYLCGINEKIREMEFTAKQIAEYIGGRVEGDETVKIHTFTKIEEGAPGAISFVANPKYTQYLYDTKASIVIVNDSLKIEKAVAVTLIRVADAYESIAKLLQVYQQLTARKREGTSSLASVASTASVGQGAFVGAFAVIGDHTSVGEHSQIYPGVVLGDNVRIGERTTLYPNVTVYDGCVIGNDVIIHSGSVIGADGFGFVPGENGYDKIPQIGNVVIEDNVEIGANTCIDRSTMSSTVIRRGVKLDNLIQIAHNVEVGANTVMSAQVGVAGSTTIGEWCMFGGQVGISGHIHIGDRTLLGAQSGAPGNIKGNETLLGSPPMNPKGFFKSQAIFRRLPEMYKQLNELQKQLDELKRTNNNAETKDAER